MMYSPGNLHELRYILSLEAKYTGLTKNIAVFKTTQKSLGEACRKAKKTENNAWVASLKLYQSHRFKENNKGLAKLVTVTRKALHCLDSSVYHFKRSLHHTIERGRQTPPSSLKRLMLTEIVCSQQVVLTCRMFVAGSLCISFYAIQKLLCQPLLSLLSLLLVFCISHFKFSSC